MMRRTAVAAAAVLVLLAGSHVEAAQCTVSTTAVTFGTYNVFNPAPVDSTGTVRYNCNGGAQSVVIAITRGQSATFMPRTLKKGTEALAYNLFQDASRTTVWGDGTGGAQFYYGGNPPNTVDVTLTIFGRIPPSQDITAGAYSDNVTVMVLF